jgi:pentatricopeptide repeat protein
LERPARRGDRAAADRDASEPVRSTDVALAALHCRAHYWSGNYSASIAVASQLRQSYPNFRQSYNTLIAALGQVGRVDHAQAVMVDGLARFGDAFLR